MSLQVSLLTSVGMGFLVSALHIPDSKVEPSSLLLLLQKPMETPFTAAERETR